MKIRNTGYATPYAPVAPAGPAERSERAAPAAETSQSANLHPIDRATILGVPEAELTPKVRAALGELMAEVQRLRLELDQARKRVDHLEQLADQDSLTPVLNRRAFVRELSRIMSFTERYGANSAVLYFDVNGLKAINDSYGHAAGDAALTHVAHVLLQHVRGSDVVGRLGGDEFGVILVQVPTDEAHGKAELLASAISAEPLTWEGVPLKVGASHGVHSLAPGQEAQDALDAADKAMYQKKRARTPSDAA